MDSFFLNKVFPPFFSNSLFFYFFMSGIITTLLNIRKRCLKKGEGGNHCVFICIGSIDEKIFRKCREENRRTTVHKSRTHYILDSFGNGRFIYHTQFWSSASYKKVCNDRQLTRSIPPLLLKKKINKKKIIFYRPLVSEILFYLGQKNKIFYCAF